jgi:hypothetical protein
MSEIGSLERRVVSGGVLDLQLVATLMGRGATTAPDELDADVALSCLQSVQRMGARLHALEVELLVAAASPAPLVEEFTLLEPDDDRERTIRIADAVREEVAAALRWSPQVAQGRIDSARLLRGELAPTAAALRAGDTTPAHAAVLVEAARRLPGRWSDDVEVGRATFAEACRRLQDLVLPVACRGTVPMTRGAADRAVLAIDADGQERRRRSARCTRDVFVMDGIDGISTLMARMATEQAHAVMALVDHAARDADAASSSSLLIGEQRAEALARLVMDPDAADQGVRAQVDVVMSLAALTQGDDGSATIDGVPVCAGSVLDLLGDPAVAVTLRRVLRAPVDGRLLEVGRRTYAVPDPIRRHVEARDRTCRFPGCRRRAVRCQIDHAMAWEDGGTTGIANLGALCVRHHQLKTFAGWALSDAGADGGCTWTSPAGRRYDHDPPPF